MAAKVQKKIDDRFYFVLDEVEGSDDDEADGNVDVHEGQNLEQKSDSQSSCILTSRSYESSSNGIVDMDVASDNEGSEIQTNAPEELPFIKISFKNFEICQKYKSKIIHSLSRILPREVLPRDAKCNTELEFWEKEEDVLFFTMDNEPETRSNYSRVPRYGKSNDQILQDPSEVPPKQNKKPSGGNICFNCEGSHNLRDCPDPKDFTVINKNRMIFQSRNQIKGPSRYHLDENQKFGHLKPGVFSKKLKTALSLKKDELPLFIYKMRTLGYPPGWLAEAKVAHSGVCLYDKTGELVLEDGEEEGEIVPDGVKDKYDTSKIIEFVGFNVKPDFEYKDEHKHFKCPPLTEEQSKEKLIEDLLPNAVQAVKRKKIKPTSTQHNSNTPSISPTIEEMEEKKRQLLLELDNADNNSPGPSVSTKKRKIGVAKAVDLGTPILQSVSPYAKIPVRERFSINICDVINFENLPDSTGKYETMVELISKIRQVVSKPDQES